MLMLTNTMKKTNVMACRIHDTTYSFFSHFYEYGDDGRCVLSEAPVANLHCDNNNTNVGSRDRLNIF